MDAASAGRFLIVNADDLGLTPGVTAAILNLARRGAVTSASAMMNRPDSAAAVAAATAINLDVGIHLTLCAGAPLSPPATVPSLLDGARLARASEIQRRYLRGRLVLDEVAREWSAQIERFLATGATPSHLDSHCHLHALPRLYRLAEELAARYGIPGLRRAYSGFILRPPHLPLVVRPLAWIMRPDVFPGTARHASCRLGRPRRPLRPYQPDHFSVLTVMGRLQSPRPLHALLRTLPRGVTELVCHPGHVDDELRRIDTLTDAREREWLLLSRPHLQQALAREGITLLSWADAAARHALPPPQ